MTKYIKKQETLKEDMYVNLYISTLADFIQHE